MHAVTDLSALGWTPDRAAELPAGCTPARVSRVDRGRLSVLTARRRERACTRVRRCTTRPDWPARRWATGSPCAANSPSRSSPGRVPSSARSPAARRRRRSWRPTSTSSWSSTRSSARPGCGGWSATSPSPGAAARRRSSSSPRPTSATTSRRPWQQVAEDALGVEVLPVSSVDRRGAGRRPRAARAGPDRGDGRPVRASGKSSLANALAGRTARRRPARSGRRRPRPAHHHRARAAPPARRRPARRHPRHARAGPLRRRRRAWTPPTPTSPLLAADCRFRDCGHRTEPGCAVAAAIDDGRLDPARYTAWRKLQAEAHRQLLRVDARARAAEKARLRSFHRALREQPNRLR